MQEQVRKFPAPKHEPHDRRIPRETSVKTKAKWRKGQFRCKLNLQISLQMPRKMARKSCRPMSVAQLPLVQPCPCKAALGLAPPARACGGSDLA